MTEPETHASAHMRHLDPPRAYTAYHSSDGRPYQVLKLGDDLAIFVQTADQCRELADVVTEMTRRQETAEGAHPEVGPGPASGSVDLPAVGVVDLPARGVVVSFRGYPVQYVTPWCWHELARRDGSLSEVLTAALDSARDLADEDDTTAGWHAATVDGLTVWVERAGGVLDEDGHHGGYWAVYLPHER